MKSFSKTLERRHHRRFAVIGNPVAMMNPGPSIPGYVTCISPDSVEITYDQVNGSTIAHTDRIDILAADFVRPVYLGGLTVKVISDNPSSDGRKPMARKRVLAFDRLTADQQNQLQNFIYSFAY